MAEAKDESITEPPAIFKSFGSFRALPCAARGLSMTGYPFLPACWAAPPVLNRPAPYHGRAHEIRRPPPLPACKWEEDKLHYEARALGTEGLPMDDWARRGSGVRGRNESRNLQEDKRDLRI
jgi:hypothetical protein